MKREECTVGAIVYHEYDGPAYRYEITGEPSFQGQVTAKIIVGNDYRNGLLDIDLIHLYDEDSIKETAAELQAKVDAAKAAFEAAFAALSDVQEYNENGINRYSLQELDILNLSDLENVVESGGWSSSSLWC